jgi:hypothetical protein
MDFLGRSKNKLYKFYKNCSVEYHAGGFFVRKVAMYVFFQTNDSLIFLEKSEGLHPFDNEYFRLRSEELANGKTFKLNNFTNNIATFSDDLNEIKIMPAVFSENYSDKKISELLVDFGNENVQIFFQVFDFSESHT